jgi:hypothetical protein
VVCHTSKTPRLPEAERIDSIVGEEDETLDRFFYFFYQQIIPLFFSFGAVTGKAGTYSSPWNNAAAGRWRAAAVREAWDYV